MLHRAICLKDTLEDLMPGYTITLGSSHDTIDTTYGPFILIEDCHIKGITLSVFGDENDDITDMARDLWVVCDSISVDITRDTDRIMSELTLRFHKMSAIVENGYRIGEALQFKALEQNYGLAA